jgi:two-component system sensor histidine kinase KdpD
MHRPSFVSFGKYLFAFAVIASVTAIFFTLRDALDITLVALLYLIPLGMITAFWGLGPGLASAALSFLTLNYFFIQPYYMLAVHQPADVIILVIFFVVAVVISQLVGRMQSGLAAATAREREATQLYELSTVLAGLHDDRAILQVLAKQVHALTQSGHVQVSITGARAFIVHLPEADVPSHLPDLSIPIQAARGVFGEIKVWKTGSGVSSEEKRLLQTFASQGALALERGWLAEAESRAKVLEESDHLKSVLLSSVSHELRTPLSTIKAAASSLRGGEVNWDSPARTDLVAAIDEEADHLNMLVGNLLDMSRIESGALKPRREWNILSEIVGGVLQRMRHLAGTHRVEMDIPESLPLLPVDYVQIEQVFTNLISNGLKYAPANSVICISAKVDGDSAHVQVSNQGPQIPAGDIERIFDKFYRLDAADRVTGTGLGLSICKGIIEAHGGRIWAENIAGGLAFNFTLPLTWDGARAPQLPIEPETE